MRSIVDFPCSLLVAVAAVLALDGCADGTAPIPKQVAARREPAVPAEIASPATSGARVYGGRSADSALRSVAAAWARRGDRSLADHIAARDARATSVRAGDLHGSSARSDDPDGNGDAGDATDADDGRADVAAITTTSSDITPSLRPTSVIYSSATAAYLSGSSGIVSSNVVYYGNMAKNVVTYTTSYADNLYPSNTQTVQHQEEGAPYPCVGSYFTCQFVFNHQTVITVGFARDCGTTLDARGDHTTWWQAPMLGYFTGAQWGFAFASNPRSLRSTNPCATTTASNCVATTTNTTLYSPTLDPGGISVPCSDPGTGTIGGGSSCGQQYIYIEMQVNGVWTVIWQGWATVCT